MTMESGRCNMGKPLNSIRFKQNGSAVVEYEPDNRQFRFDDEIWALFDLIRDGLVVFDMDGSIIEVNRVFSERLGYTREEMVGMRISQIDLPDDAGQAFLQKVEVKAAGKAAYVHKSGTVLPSEVSGKVIKLDGQDCLFSIVREIRDPSSATSLAYYDPLTDLPNRRMMQDRLKQALAASSRSEKNGALLFLDLDNFKTVNNIRGHDAGEVLLQKVALRLRAALRESDTVARFGGDEFVVILEELDAMREGAASYAGRVGDKLLLELSKPYDLQGKEYTGSASMGIVVFGDANENVNELLKCAEMAMYEAKKAGRNSVRFFDRAMQAAIEQKAQINTGLRAALRLRRFVPYFQKLVNSQGKVHGAEVLVRWQDPERGLIPPMEFIPLAEETGLIVSIGLWMLEEVCLQLKAWGTHEHAKEFTLSVNISSLEFKQKDFVVKVRHVLEKTGANPALLELEITESVLLDNIEDMVAKMGELREMGVSFALDDFGTGYSSLSYLKRLPLNKIKIDQSFIKDLGEGENDTAIVQTIIQMGKALGLEVIAEGVETELQRNLLEQLGCHNYQGYLFGKPVPIDIFEKEIRECPGFHA